MNSSSLFQFLLKLIPYPVRKVVKKIPVAKQIQAVMVNTFLRNKSFNATISAGPVKGLIFPVQMPQDKLMWLGTWETDFSEKMAEIIPKKGVCYDIGAYKGYFSGLMALHGAKRVIIFEPMPTNADNIRKLIKLNHNLPFDLVEAAVSNKTGKVSFKTMPEQTMGKLETSGFQHDESFLSKIEVDCLKLDDVVKSVNFPLPDFVKIDVEGAEELVLLGAEEVLRQKKPVLMIEIHSNELGKKCYSILKKYYQEVKVLETSSEPDENTPEICHYIALN
jgi:FkbM family methyltransferase